MAWSPLRIIGVLLTFGSIALLFGCQESSQADKSKPSSTRPVAKSVTQPEVAKAETNLAKGGDEEIPNIPRKADKSLSKRPKSKTPPPPPTIPNVGLSDSLRATCLVNVGDIMPDAELLAADGGKVSLESQYGEKYTVLFLWSEGGSNYARLAADSALSDLQNDVAVPYAAKGIKVIGINEGDKPRSVQQELQKIGIKVPCFFDPDNAFFAKVAKTILPRVYLLDASGKIIWFDTEYTQSTRRNLMMAVHVVMGEK